jgi:hypothetical protein
MPDPALQIALCRSIALRAHIAAAQAIALECEALNAPEVVFPCPRADALRRRYWRELEAAGILSGAPWPDAGRLGAEPTIPQLTPQETR